MSIIRAKQQICINITTIRSLSTYTSGRYCLRFYLSQINNNLSQLQNSISKHYHNKYAIPVSIIQYKNNILPPSLQKNFDNIKGNNQIFQDISQYVYTTKPFIFKQNQDVPIYQICIFKYDINIFSNKYEMDFHQIVMQCTCQLVSVQYGGTNGLGRVVSTFDGRIKGVGVNDTLVVDFYEGVPCQVLGLVNSCVYQFEYVYTGEPLKQPKVKQGRYSSEIQLDEKGKKQKQDKNKIQKNKYISNIQSGNNYITKEYTYNIDRDNLINSMTFQMYCSMQKQQYVQSLLQYLLDQVKISQDKINYNLQRFQNIQLNHQQFHKLENRAPSISQSISVSVSFNSNDIKPQPQQPSNGQIRSILQNSIRSQSSLNINSVDYVKTKQRLSIIKQQHQINHQHKSADYNNDYIDNDHIQQKEEQLINKIQSDEDQIILQQQQIQIQNIDSCKCKSNRKFNSLNILEKQIKKINYQDDAIFHSLNFNINQINQNYQLFTKSPIKYVHQSYQQNNNITGKQQYQQQGKRKRKKIFIQSSNINEIAPKNINLNNNPISQAQSQKINPKSSQPVVKSETPILLSPPTLQPNTKQQTQRLTPDLDFLQMTSKQSYYGKRQIPTINIQMHPNHLAIKEKKNNNSQKVSPLTIQQFQRIIHSQCLKIYEKWRQFINLLTQPQSILVVKAYQNVYKTKLLSLLGESIIRFKGSFDIDIYSKQQSQRNKMALQIRNQVKQNEKSILINQFQFYNKNLYNKSKPIMFEQNFSNFSKINYNQLDQQDETPKKKKKQYIKISLQKNKKIINKYLIFLVHGLGACRLDMDKLKIQIKRYFSYNVHVIICSSNQGKTQGDINMMGVKLAHQVDQQITKFNDNLDDDQIMKVSFFGHSMGGVIIRSALPRLEKYKDSFHSFVTLSTPHVGYCYSNSKLVDVGLWLINNWKKCQSILQLTMQDTKPVNSQKNTKSSLQQTFMYKLSQQKGLQWFKKITLLASRQDLYVPYFSARIQKHQQCLTDLKNNNRYAIIHTQMIDNILSKIKGIITRIDVNFCINQQSVDNLIGRTAHIYFINNLQFLRLLIAADQNTII